MTSLTVLKVGWHREHFLSPLLQFAAEDNGKTFELIECPGGTGDMQAKLKSGEIDVCIALTEALIAGIANGHDHYKLIGRYISTPLRWAVVTGKTSQYTTISSLKSTTFGISRFGSGSQVMASVMALQEGWGEEDAVKFEVKGKFGPLRDSVNSGETSAFLWEWFTTKPFEDSGEVRLIGSVYTPWPCWMIAASPAINPTLATQFLTSLSTYATSFDSSSNRQSDGPSFVEQTFGQKPEDVKEWFESVAWYHDEMKVEKKVVEHVLEVLEKAGTVTKPSAGWDVSSFVNEEIAQIV